ncbi:MAG: 4-oxalocrotonate tautomerase [Chloroflexi bacterium]|nr:4-oxalocrotonate tautomerase [Chloroflexota bacterium]
MPTVRVEMYEGRSVDQKRALSKAITEAVMEHANVSAESVHVVFTDIPRTNWAVAGVLASDK